MSRIFRARELGVGLEMLGLAELAEATTELGISFWILFWSIVLVRTLGGRCMES